MKQKILYERKRGQVTLFIILGIIIVSLILIFTIFRTKISEKISEIKVGEELALPPELRIVKNNIEDCISTLGMAALYYLGIQGGYIGEINPSLEYGSLDVAYYYYKGNKNIPTKKNMETAVENYIRKYLKECVNVPKDFEVETGAIKPEVEIGDEVVVIDVYWPVSIKKGDLEAKINKFHKRINLRVGELLTVANAIVIDQLLHKNEICVDCIASIALDNDVDIKLENVEDDLLLTIVDNKFKLMKGPYFFRFAMKF